MSLKTVAGAAVCAFLIFWVIEQPSGASHVVANIATFLTAAAREISNFFSKV